MFPKYIKGSLRNDDGDVNENGKKAIGLDWQDNNFARVSRFFCTFLCRHCTTTMWNVLIPPFLENVNTRPRLSFSFPELRYSLLEFNSRKKLCQHLTNWTRRNKRYLVWSSLNSPFKWRFHSHRRLCCLSSLLISWTPPLKNKHLAAPNARIFQLFVLGCLPFVKTDLPDQFNRKGSSTINHGCQASQFLNTLRDRNGF